MVGDDGADIVRAEVRDILCQLGDVVEKARRFDHKDLAVFFDQKAFVAYPVIRLKRMQLDCAEIVHLHGAL